MGWTKHIKWTAILVYIISSLPAIFSSGIFGGLLCFLLGCICSAVACIVSVAVMLYHVTEPKELQHGQGEVKATRSLRQLSAFSRISKITRNIASSAVAGGQMVLRRGKKSGQVQHTIVCGPPKPHPGTYNAGHFEGTIWTIPPSAWPREKLLPLHPPESEGPNAISHMWHARVANGILTLTPLGELGARKKTEILLRNCSIQIVRECMEGALLPESENRGQNAAAGTPTQQQTQEPPRKSPWMKRGALELSLINDGGRIAGEATAAVGGSPPNDEGGARSLVYGGEDSVFLFARSGAAKEQWYVTLSAQTHPSGQEATVREMYQEYSRRMGGAAEALGVSELLSGPMLEVAPGSDIIPQKNLQGQSRTPPPLQVGSRDLTRESMDGKTTSRAPGRKFGWLFRLIPGRRGGTRDQPSPPTGLPRPSSTSAIAPLPITNIAATGSKQEDIARLSQALVDSTHEAPISCSLLSQSSNLGKALPKPNTFSLVQPGWSNISTISSAESFVSRQHYVPETSAAHTGAKVTSKTMPHSKSLSSLPGVGSTRYSHHKLVSSSSVSPLITAMATTDEAAAVLPSSADASFGPGVSSVEGEARDSAGNASCPPELPSTGLTIQPLVTERAGPDAMAASHNLVSPSRPTPSGHDLHLVSELPPLEPGGASPVGSQSGGRMRRARSSSFGSEGEGGSLSGDGSAAMSRPISSPSSLQNLRPEEIVRRRAAVEASAVTSSAPNLVLGDGRDLSKEPEPSLSGAAATTAREAPPANQVPEDSSPRPAPEGFSVPGVVGVNMLLTRLGFELLAGHTLQRWLSRTVQRRLDDFKRPSYLHPLKVVSVDFGSTFPLVRDARAVAGPLNTAPGSCPWPQLILDLAYSGRISMTVSTTVELQQAGLIKKLQSTFGKMAGLQADKGASVSASLATSSPESLKSTSVSLEQSVEAGGGGSGGPAATAQAGGRRVSGTGGGGGLIAGFVRAAAAKAGSIAAGLTEAALPPLKFELEIVITKLEVELMLWVAPPPSDRLWFSMVSAPKVVMTTQPVLANRVIRYSVLLGQVSSLVKSKILKAINRQLVYPSCADVRLGFFANPDTAAVKLTPFMSGEPAPESASTGVSVHPAPADHLGRNSRPGSQGSLDAMYHPGSLTPELSRHSAATTPAASGASTPAISSLRASAPLPSGLVSAAVSASMLPPKAPKLGVSQSVGSLGSGAGPASQQQQQGKRLGFRFRFWGGGQRGTVRGASADGSSAPAVIGSAAASSGTSENNIATPSVKTINMPSDVDAGLTDTQAEVGQGDSVVGGGPDATTEGSRDAGLRRRRGASATSPARTPRSSMDCITEAVRGATGYVPGPSIAVPPTDEEALPTPFDHANPEEGGAHPSAATSAKVSLEDFITPLSVASEDP